MLPLRLALATPLLHTPLRRESLFLVGCCIINQSSIGGRLRPRCIFIFFIFCRSIRRPKQWDNVPHTFRPGRVSSPTPPSPSTTTFGWLLCPPIKRRPSKAKGPPIYLFFLSINSTPQTTGSRPPHTFRPSIASSPTHPLTSSPSPI